MAKSTEEQTAQLQLAKLKRGAARRKNLEKAMRNAALKAKESARVREYDGSSY